MRYETLHHQTFRLDDKGERELLANFDAEITHETHYIDGRSRETILTISATKPGPDPEKDEPITLPSLDVEASDFPSLSWVLPNWGVQAVIRPGGSIRDDLRTAIQLKSKPEVKTIYKHIGWATIKGKLKYLHATGAIDDKGNDKSVEVRLPVELERYNLSSETEIRAAINATLALIKLAKPEITWPLLAASLAPLFGPIDFGLHLTGRTGSFKSEVMSLYQSHYGSGMDARHLPGSWSSTANALEAQAFLAKNAAFVVDDFVPTGTAWQVRAYQVTADKIIRSQGNQSGRARLTDTSNLQQTMYPRGIIMSTGEDTPEGHSVRARILILELSPGDIDVAKLTAAQKRREDYPSTTRNLIQHLAGEPADLTPRADEIRNKNLTIGHTRTPAMLGRLVATAEYFINWAAFVKAISPGQERALIVEATTAIIHAGNAQIQYLEATDPTDLFLGAIRQAVAAGLGHFRTLNGGIPLAPELLGWTSEKSLGELPTFKSRGPCLGWVDWQADEMLLDITAGFAIVRKIAGTEVSLTKQTLFKRLKDAGKLSRTDDGRQRNTIRMNAEGHPRNVLALILSTALDTQEKPQDE